MADKARATLPETVEKVVKPAAPGEPKKIQTTVEGAREVTKAGPEAIRSEK